MTKAITVRMDDVDHDALEKQAALLQVRPGTLARMLVHAGLGANDAIPGEPDPRGALDRLVSRSRRQASADAVGLVTEARVALDR